MPFSLIPHGNFRTFLLQPFYFAAILTFIAKRILHNHCLIDDLLTAQAKRPTGSHCHNILLTLWEKSCDQWHTRRRGFGNSDSDVRSFGGFTNALSRVWVQSDDEHFIWLANSIPDNSYIANRLPLSSSEAAIRGGFNITSTCTRTHTHTRGQETKIFPYRL